MILCGGTGTRLWPVSRQSYPKQFVPLQGEYSLFQNTLKRVESDAFEPPIIVTADDYRFIVREQMDQVHVKPLSKLIEPSPKNTAPAILAAALHLYEKDTQAIMLVLSSDHWVADDEAFRKALQDENFRGNWMNNVDPAVLEAAGITSFSDMNDPDKVKAYQEAWNKANPDNQIVVDGKFGEQTFRTAIAPTEDDT